MYKNANANSDVMLICVMVFSSQSNFSVNSKQIQAILVKLLSHDKKEFIYNRRHLLRKMPEFKGIFINENLTPFRRKLFSRVRNTFKQLDLECWSNDGKIHLLDKSYSPNKLWTITNYDDFYNIVDRYF